MADNNTVFVINPGSTSTKMAFVDGAGKMVWEITLRHENEAPMSLRELVPVRNRQIREQLAARAELLPPRAVVGRGGPLRPLEGGTYAINDALLGDLLTEKYSKHVSNLGAPIAQSLAAEWRVPAFVVDPVTVDNFTDVARISGVPEIQRKCRSHALNIRSCGYLAASESGKPLAQTKFIVAHLGGGISIAAVDGGRIVDVNDALLGMGPFSPERAGALPLEGLLNLAASEKYPGDKLKAYLSKGCGLKGYLGTASMVEVEAMIDKGDKNAELIFRAMVYQIAKEIGACASVLRGKQDAILITGGLAYSQKVLAELKSYIDWLGKIIVYPGERELEALAAGAFRVLNGNEAAKEY